MLRSNEKTTSKQEPVETSHCRQKLDRESRWLFNFDT
jgi:hypothetical protein